MDLSKPALTVVIPLRDRAGVRLRNCLRSLRWQTGIDARDVDIIVSDLGSEPSAREEVRALAAEHSARVFFTDDTNDFSRGRALNIGIRRARGRFTLCTDVDMIFAPRFLRTLLEAQSEHADRALVLCQALDLDRDTVGRSVELEDLEPLRARATLRTTHGPGGCQIAATAWFHRVRGFDEGMAFWGFEDKDLARRAAGDGLVNTWVTDRTFMLHQWHPTREHDRPWQTKQNELRYRFTGWIVRKNWLGWGE
jgi:glycosyltransferase involved in cell wall biosynthesis